jgi:hypothetical protein
LNDLDNLDNDLGEDDERESERRKSTNKLSRGKTINMKGSDAKLITIKQTLGMAMRNLYLKNEAKISIALYSEKYYQLSLFSEVGLK